MVDKAKIPHAVRVTVIRGFPYSTLHVATRLVQNFGEPGFDAEANAQMMDAIAKLLDDEVKLFQIHWGFKGDA